MSQYFLSRNKVEITHTFTASYFGIFEWSLYYCTRGGSHHTSYYNTPAEIKSEIMETVCSH